MSYYDTMITSGWGWALTRAAGVSLLLAITAILVGGVIGGFVARAKLGSSRALKIAADSYTTLIRGVPDLLVIYLFYFGGSNALGIVGGIFGVTGFIEIPPFLTGALAIGVISGAYQGEVYRGAFQAIAKGEIEAARSVGMGRFLLFRRVIAPQVVRFSVPGLGNCWQLALKETALISVIGLVELLRQASIGAGSTLQPFYFYATAAALYLVLTGFSSVGFERAEILATRGLRRA